MCPNCGSSRVQAGIGDRSQCTNCGSWFNQDGVVASGPDQNTRDILQGRLDQDRTPQVGGNYADLQRLGAESLSSGATKVDSAVAVPPNMTKEQAEKGAERLLEEDALVRDARSEAAAVADAPKPKSSGSKSASKDK